MGWLFGQQDDGFYRGDAPASVPGIDGLQPAVYQGSTFGSGTRPGPRRPGTRTCPRQFPRADPTTPQADPTTPPPEQAPGGRPCDLASAMVYVQNQQWRVIRTTLGKAGALIAGGCEPLLSTLILQPDETATGLIAFDTNDSSAAWR